MVNEYTEPLSRFEEKLDGILSFLIASVNLFPARIKRRLPSPLWPVRFPAYRPELGAFSVEARIRDAAHLSDATDMLHWGMPN